jgi:hypothetical protein
MISLDAPISRPRPRFRGIISLISRDVREWLHGIQRTSAAIAPDAARSRSPPGLWTGGASCDPARAADSARAGAAHSPPAAAHSPGPRTGSLAEFYVFILWMKWRCQQSDRRCSARPWRRVGMSESCAIHVAMDGDLEPLGERMAKQAAHHGAAMARSSPICISSTSAAAGTLRARHRVRTGWPRAWLGSSTARERVRVAREPGEFPVISEALRQGEALRRREALRQDEVSSFGRSGRSTLARDLRSSSPLGRFPATSQTARRTWSSIPCHLHR